jgi:hypothetical protein
MLHRPGVMAMTRDAASVPTPLRRRARTMKKSPIDMPPVSVGAVMTNPPRAPATVMSHARCSGLIPARKRSRRLLLNVGMGKMPIGLRQVVPVQLTQVLQHGAVRTVHRDEFNRIRWRPRWKWRRVCRHRTSLSRCVARPLNLDPGQGTAQRGLQIHPVPLIRNVGRDELPCPDCRLPRSSRGAAAAPSARGRRGPGRRPTCHRLRWSRALTETRRSSVTFG